ncbi:uncharacterized protein TRIADDRAFT_60999 [Trichoplax adhaerens]|uniref:Uncharacterized protein n=1 Tax=Trichoplax adhaerens TaxID=10228 RepID=B3S9R3_TRIAD|nr:predicted protein [Trichoplax adhaerens]EDV20582.1 predicted protein [Trichoplax adhaerens]|eukprot:XP_002117008.1 predicted protein [Trichoplax adhaerens]
MPLLDVQRLCLLGRVISQRTKRRVPSGGGDGDATKVTRLADDHTAKPSRKTADIQNTIVLLSLPANHRQEEQQLPATFPITLPSNRYPYPMPKAKQRSSNRRPWRGEANEGSLPPPLRSRLADLFGQIEREFEIIYNENAIYLAVFTPYMDNPFDEGPIHLVYTSIVSKNKSASILEEGMTDR